ncbi:MAG TPA: ABC transporter ATP-binding protein [Methylomirabilota bacterium]|jgi:branched-chain amino acid transport system ATP-binding protein|nr:ABC transporter ATP-binding protein [Methylomirabilota bacterium]
MAQAPLALMATLLEAEGLTKTFGALRAVAGVDLAVEAGSLHSVIGPNGAGKTTLFNLITGELPPTAGRITLDGHDITGRAPHAMPGLGIARSFQRNNLFPNLTVAQNVWTAAFARARHGLRLWRSAVGFADVAAAVAEALGEVGLASHGGRKAREMSHGDQRLLEVAIALASRPRLLLLDEPTSGLSPEETRRMMGLIRTLRGRYTILLIEHKMDLVMTVSDRITVMHFGSVLAEGPPTAIQGNADVRRAYLGTATALPTGP